MVETSGITNKRIQKFVWRRCCFYLLQKGERMKLLLTGTPGTGKTTLAKMLGKKWNALVVNEHGFAEKNRLGKADGNSGELVLDVVKLEKKLNAFIADFDGKGKTPEKSKFKKIKSKKNVQKNKPKNLIIEGHVVSEAKLNVDQVLVLRTSIPVLWKRLERKRYSAEKVFDNLSCEAMDYCGGKALKNYPAEKVFEIWNDKGLKDAERIILTKLKGLK